MSLSQSTMSSNSTVVAKESSNSLAKFPFSREKEEFPDWIFKLESFFDARELLEVVNKPIRGLKEFRSRNEERSKSEQEESEEEIVEELNENDKKKFNALLLKSKKAYNYIIQSLNKKQIELIRGVELAYVVLKTLKRTYGIIKSTTSTMSLFTKLNTNKKLQHESITDINIHYFKSIFALNQPNA